MKPSTFNEAQIIDILREAGAGAKTADPCRRHRISTSTFYAWKATFGGMEVSDAKRLKALEDANAMLTWTEETGDTSPSSRSGPGKSSLPRSKVGEQRNSTADSGISWMNTGGHGTTTPTQRSILHAGSRACRRFTCWCSGTDL
ncbi:MAG: transposase [Maritimibacter sp.]|nr:transposase [Maritimibacter sp.]